VLPRSLDRGLRHSSLDLLAIRRGVATGWTGVDMSPILPKSVPAIDAGPLSLDGRLGVEVGRHEV